MSNEIKSLTVKFKSNCYGLVLGQPRLIQNVDVVFHGNDAELLEIVDNLQVQDCTGKDPLSLGPLVLELDTQFKNTGHGEIKLCNGDFNIDLSLTLNGR